MNRDPKLTPKQAEFLSLLVEGNLQDSVHRKMKITYSGFFFHIKALLEAHEVHSRSDLLAGLLLVDNDTVKPPIESLNEIEISVVNQVLNGNTLARNISPLLFRAPSSITATNSKIFRKYGVNNMIELIYVLAGVDYE
jgi:DNA-binding NarL/FixJ family response regulator